MDLKQDIVVLTAIFSVNFITNFPDNGNFTGIFLKNCKFNHFFTSYSLAFKQKFP